MASELFVFLLVTQNEAPVPIFFDPWETHGFFYSFSEERAILSWGAWTKSYFKAYYTRESIDLAQSKNIPAPLEFVDPI